METKNPVVVKIENVKRDYHLGETVVNALRGVSLIIEKGAFLAITGPSGSGKSTLMHLIGCLDTPSSGKLFIEDEDVSELNENELAYIRNKKIGFVFQQFNLLSRINILDNVMTPLLYAGIPLSKRKEMALEALDQVGLSDRLLHKPSELSGGQRQRVAIARALVTRPQVILADEPTGALDSETGKNILDMFKEINGNGKTVIIVTHDPVISAVCSRSISLYDGLIINEN